MYFVVIQFLPLVCRYNLEEKAYKPEPQVEQVTVQYASDGCLVWRDSEEGHRVVRAKAMVEELESKPVRPLGFHLSSPSHRSYVRWTAGVGGGNRVVRKNGRTSG